MWLLVGAAVIAALVLIPARGRRSRARRAEAERRRNAEGPADVTVALREEQLQIRKTKQDLADVRTHTEVIHEMKTVTVPVAREELVVEQDGAEVARIPLREERVDVSTYDVPLNDVAVYEREWSENREIREMVRKEVARIETSGEAEVREAP